MTWGCRFVSVATALAVAGCSSSPSSSVAGAAVTAQANTTTAAAPATSATETTTTLAATTTVPPTTTELPTTTTEPPDTGTVDVIGSAVEPVLLDARFVVMNNTNHGVTDVQLHLDFVNGKGEIVGSRDDILSARLAPGDFVEDHATVSAAPGVDLIPQLKDVHITVVSSSKISLPRSPISIEDLRTVPAPKVTGGGTVALGTFVNVSDVDQDIAPLHSLVLDESGRAIIDSIGTPTWMKRLKPGAHEPFALNFTTPGVTPDRVRISVTSSPSPAPFQAKITVSPVTVFIDPTRPNGGPDTLNLQAVGLITNDGTTAFAVPDQAGMCVVRDSGGTIVDLSPVTSFTNSGNGPYALALDTDVEPGASVPFGCIFFDAAMATPLATNLAAYAVDVVMVTESFTTAARPPGIVETPATVAATFTSNSASVDVTFTNTQPNPSQASVQVRVYDAASGRLVAFSDQSFIEVINGNGVYDIAPGATKTTTVYVDLPPGTDSASVRIEASAALGQPFNN